MSDFIQDTTREALDEKTLDKLAGPCWSFDHHSFDHVSFARSVLRAALADAPAVPDLSSEPTRCANCGTAYAEQHGWITEGDPEGEAFCSQACIEQHDELGCPHEHHHGYRHPTEAARLIACENVLRSLASYLGCGGYNAPEVDAAVFEGKIRYGIDNFVAPLAATPAAVQAAKLGEAWSSARCALEVCGDSDEHDQKCSRAAVPVQQGREALPTEAESNECNASWAQYVMNLNGAPTTTSEVYRAAWFMSRAALAATPQAPQPTERPAQIWQDQDGHWAMKTPALLGFTITHCNTEAEADELAEFWNRGFAYAASQLPAQAPAVPPLTDERAQFEAWLRERDPLDANTDKRENGSYLYGPTQSRWQAWQGCVAAHGIGSASTEEAIEGPSQKQTPSEEGACVDQCGDRQSGETEPHSTGVGGSTPPLMVPPVPAKLLALASDVAVKYHDYMTLRQGNWMANGTVQARKTWRTAVEALEAEAHGIGSASTAPAWRCAMADDGEARCANPCGNSPGNLTWVGCVKANGTVSVSGGCVTSEPAHAAVDPDAALHACTMLEIYLRDQSNPYPVGAVKVIRNYIGRTCGVRGPEHG
jgi:hypothetical protein